MADRVLHLAAFGSVAEDFMTSLCGGPGLCTGDPGEVNCMRCRVQWDRACDLGEVDVVTVSPDVPTLYVINGDLRNYQNPAPDLRDDYEFYYTAFPIRVKFEGIGYHYTDDRGREVYGPTRWLEERSAPPIPRSYVGASAFTTASALLKELYPEPFLRMIPEAPYAEQREAQLNLLQGIIDNPSTSGRQRKRAMRERRAILRVR